MFVNEENYKSVSSRFDLDSFDAAITTLNIPDEYDHMDSKLIDIFIKCFEPLTRD